MSGLVAVVGSRELSAGWAARVASVVGDLLRRGCQVGSGGALGADLFALQAVVASGRCQGARVFLPGSVEQAPWRAGRRCGRL
jgi:predicted Rossmann fold nucleotide-binding protein DprA/Smf involved in DNA uptake